VVDAPKGKRPDSPIFVRSEVDDLGLSVEAFRVYGHLARRAGANNDAWPSYQSIGDTCFSGSHPPLKPESRRRKAMRAVKELERRGLIKVNRRRLNNSRGSLSNQYQILPLSKWPTDIRPKRKRGAGTSKPS